MKNIRNVVAGLTDVQVVTLLKQLNRDLYQVVPFREVESRLLDNAPVESLHNLDLAAKKAALDPETSVAASRQILTAFASSEELAPVVQAAWEEIRDDDSLFIETIVAVGLVANLTLFMATTEIEFKWKGLTIRKKTADASVVKEVVLPIIELIKGRIPGVGG